MRAFGKRSMLLASAVMLGGLFYSAPAAAQATRTWVSGVGDDANPCSRTAPCKTFAGSIAKTAAGGEINCLDAGGFGAVTITKSISLICTGVEAGILVSGGNGVNIVAATTDVVVIDGLEFEGFGSGTNGIRVGQAGTVIVRNTTIADFRGANGTGILFQPGNAGAKLIVDNTKIHDNGFAGILIQPTGTGSGSATVTNSKIQDNVSIGVSINTTGNTGTGVAVTLDNVALSTNGAGLLAKAPAASAPVKFWLLNSTVNSNVSQGVIANAGAAGLSTGVVGNSAIIGNGTGIFLLGSGVVNSYGNNQLNGNGTDGAFSGTVPPM